MPFIVRIIVHNTILRQAVSVSIGFHPSIHSRDGFSLEECRRAVFTRNATKWGIRIADGVVMGHQFGTKLIITVFRWQDIVTSSKIGCKSLIEINVLAQVSFGVFMAQVLFPCTDCQTVRQFARFIRRDTCE
jgi:hypothetical protein